MRKQKGKEKLNLKDPKDRWQFCREVRLPDHYYTPGKPDPHTGKPSEPTKIRVAESISKAVLLDLAQYDWPGNTNYKGNGNISHGTGIPIRSVSKGISVLKSIGALDREPQGVKMTAISRLNWAVLDKLREPFRGENAAPTATDDPNVPDDLDEELEALKAEDDDKDDVSDLGPRTAPKTTGGTQTELVNLLLEFGPYRNIRPVVESAIKGLLKTTSADDIRKAWASLKPWQKIKAKKGRNPGGYLRTMLTNAIEQKPEPEPEGDSDGWWGNHDMMEGLIAHVRDTGEDMYVNLARLSNDNEIASFTKWATEWLDHMADELEYEVEFTNKRIRIFACALAR